MNTDHRSIRELVERLNKKRSQIREYIAGIDPTTGESRYHALIVAEGRLLQIDMDIAEATALLPLCDEGRAARGDDAEKRARNTRVQARWDELWREGKHGHYETLFRVVREEVERATGGTKP